jgi:hypothetical protein
MVPLEREQACLASDARPRLAIAWARADNGERADVHCEVFDEGAPLPASWSP